jgi:CHASE2 domain-containing sensor protein
VSSSIHKINNLKVFATIIASAVIAYAITFISDRVNFLERFSLAASDIDFTDVYYNFRPALPRDTKIVLVNIGHLNRSELADMFSIIHECQPKVLGIDIFFDEHVDSSQAEGTAKLASVFQAIDRDVLAFAYVGKDDEDNDIIMRQSPSIRTEVTESIVNLNIATDDPEMGTVRSFNPLTDVNGEKVIFFGHQIASYFNPDIALPETESDSYIRWYGYARRSEVADSLAIFHAIDGSDILARTFNPADLKNKIVLAGYTGETLSSEYRPADQFFSPLNHKMVGRSLPDIYGVEVHANIVKMIIDDDGIFHSRVIDFLVNLLSLSIFAVFLKWLYNRYERQYALLSKVALIIFVDIILLTVISISFASDGSFKIIVFDGLFVMLFMPDTYEFLVNNVFNRKLSFNLRKAPMGSA